jgi:DNA polymerase bacteriophage-type
MKQRLELQFDRKASSLGAIPLYLKTTKFWIDLETRASTPIRHGHKKYATTVEVFQVHWALDDGEVHIEDLSGGKKPSKALLAIAHRAVDDPSVEVWAHGAGFDRSCIETTNWWPLVPAHRWRCTMAMARMHGLPGGLDKLSGIFKLPPELAKDERGKDLIPFFCIPQKNGKYREPRDHSEKWQQFLSYGGQDVACMRAVWNATPKWNATPRMWAFWHLDQRMNERGVAVDLLLAEQAVIATTKAKARLAARTKQLTKLNPDYLEETESALEATTQVARLRAYMQEFGIELPDLKADTVERRLEDESLPDHIKELLRIRQKASKASTAKYKRAITQHVGGRLCDLLVFCGASRTGRWAGRTLQPQNLPRPKHSQKRIETAIRLLQMGEIDLMDPEDVLGLASSCLRGLIVADKGNKLVVSDLANIEGRFMAWIAGEQWKLDAFALYDAGKGPDLYIIAYCRAFNLPFDAIKDDKDPRRQIGKVMELALQYYGGVGAFCAMAETYHLKLDKLAASAWPVIPDEIKADSRRLYARAKKSRRGTYGLAEREWLVCQSLVTLWRRAHPKIVKFWELLDTAIKAAIRSPNKVFHAGDKITVDRRGNWLRLKLPSGRYLCYPAPRSTGDGRSFIGVNPYTKQWGRISTYSGKDAENVVQGGCADIMMDGLLAADEAGYNPVLSVHDEAITEPPDDSEYNERGLSALLVGSSAYTTGLPLAAKGFESYRYRKN